MKERYTISEIAAILDVSERTVHRKLSKHGRKKYALSDKGQTFVRHSFLQLVAPEKLEQTTEPEPVQLSSSPSSDTEKLEQVYKEILAAKDSELERTTEQLERFQSLHSQALEQLAEKDKALTSLVARVAAMRVQLAERTKEQTTEPKEEPVLAGAEQREPVTLVQTASLFLLAVALVAAVAFFVAR